MAQPVMPEAPKMRAWLPGSFVLPIARLCDKVRGMVENRDSEQRDLKRGKEIELS